LGSFIKCPTLVNLRGPSRIALRATWDGSAKGRLGISRATLSFAFRNPRFRITSSVGRPAVLPARPPLAEPPSWFDLPLATIQNIPPMIWKDFLVAPRGGWESNSLVNSLSKNRRFLVFSCNGETTVSPTPFVVRFATKYLP